VNKSGFCDPWKSKEELGCYIFFVLSICVAVTTIMGPVLGSPSYEPVCKLGRGKDQFSGEVQELLRDKKNKKTRTVNSVSSICLVYQSKG